MSLDPTRLGHGLSRLTSEFALESPTGFQYDQCRSIAVIHITSLAFWNHLGASSLASCLNLSLEDDPLAILSDRASSFICWLKQFTFNFI